MSSAGWFLLVGGLMLAMGLATPMVRRLPVNPAMIYLSVGLLVGPTVFGLFHFNPLKQSALLEILTEVAVLIALRVSGGNQFTVISVPSRQVLQPVRQCAPTHRNHGRVKHIL